MRRALASLLLGLISFPLIAPVLLADADSDLPACCRRDGKHRCSMGPMGMEDTLTGQAPAPVPAVSPIRPKCPCYPATITASGESSVGFLKSFQAVCPSLVSHPASGTQTEALYRLSFSRCRHKRGPPAFLS